MTIFSEGHSSLDRLVIDTAMQLSAERGWQGFSLVDIALIAEIPLEEIRKHYPCKSVILLRLNSMIDNIMLCGAESFPSPREGLFDLFMRRFDALQDYRDGLKSVMRIVPLDPPLAALLGGATLTTIKWVADTAGIDSTGISGKIRLQALLMIWVQTLRSWERDSSLDLSETMLTLDKALRRAERFNLLKVVKRQDTDRQEVSSSCLPDYEPDGPSDL